MRAMYEPCQPCNVPNRGVQYVGGGIGEFAIEPQVKYVGCGGDYSVRRRSDCTCCFILLLPLALLALLLCLLAWTQWPVEDCRVELANWQTQWPKHKALRCCAQGFPTCPAIPMNALGNVPAYALGSGQSCDNMFGTVGEKRVVFVIDKSGSMDEEAAPGGPTLDEKSFEALSKLLHQLAADVQFNLVTFNSDAFVLWTDLQSATPANVDAALAWVQGNAGGSTNVQEGLAWAFGMATRPDRIYLLADGEPNRPRPSSGAPAEALAAVPAMDSGRNIPVNTILFSDADTQGKAADFMKQLAANTGGSYAAVSFSSATNTGWGTSLLRC